MTTLVGRAVLAARSDTAGGGSGFFAHHGIWAPGVRLFRRLRFTAKAAIISAAFVVPATALLAWQAAAEYEQAMEARKAATRSLVEVAHGVVAAAHARQLSGAVSLEQAQAQAREQLARLRYAGSEYFWINDMQPRIVMHPIKPELDGRDAKDMRDPNGLALFVAFVDVVRRSGEGFVAYQWPKPGSDRPVDKISYVKGFEPWGWVIGSGIYVNDLRERARAKAAQDASIVALSLLIAGYLFISFYRVMDGGLKETRRHLRAMSAGDLTTSPNPWGRDEPAQLMFELRHMQESLRSIVSQVRRASGEIVQSSGEISTGAHDLSSRTEAAAASLEQSAAAIEQISVTIRNNSDHTLQAAQAAERNAGVAAEGGRTMQAVEGTMESIRRSSAQIGEIISVIDSIAFQTNILALNAAVEAARAGEEGRGFAVVAGEVRTLAQRSATAAREIKALIGASVEEVNTAAQTVRLAGDTIREIVATSHRVNQLLAEVTGGAREQSAGIGQIGQAVSDLDLMTQQNAALVEQTAAASSALKEQAMQLDREVSRFRLPSSAA